jgi:hypothetical protein
MRTRILALTLFLAVSAVVAQPAAAEVVPATLTGETLVGVPEVTASCNDDLSGTISFRVSGVATGPYPGTFTETGTATSSPVGETGPLVLALDAAFTIQSGPDVVTGTKHFNARLESLGICDPAGVVVVIGSTTYTARISASSGSFSDRGGSDVAFENIADFIVDFTENFTSELAAPVPETPQLPQTKEACKRGGWETFGVFKNQGDCVSFVATNGKNQPNANVSG